MCCNDEQRKGLIRKNNYQPPPVFRTTSENAPILNSSIFGVRMGDANLLNTNIIYDGWLVYYRMDMIDSTFSYA